MKTRAILAALVCCATSAHAAMAEGEADAPAVAPAPAAPASAAPAPVAPAPASAASAPADCGAPAETRAPDPRCGETLDGRPPPGPASSAFARGALAVPRVATQVLLWPVVETSDVVEHHHLLDWMAALFTTDDGLVGARPYLNYSTGFLASLGARLFWRRLPGQHELAAHLESGGRNIIITRLHFRPLKPAAPGPGEPPLFRALEPLGFIFDFTWNLRNDRLFAGIGPNSKPDLTAAGQGLARYGSSAFGAEARWSLRLPARLAVQLHADGQYRNYQSTNVVSGESVSTLFGLPPAQCAALGLTAPCVDPQQLPGFTTGMRLLHGGATLRLNLREPGREGAGFTFLVDGTYARGVSSDPDQHATFSAESVLALGGINRTLIVRGRAAVVETFDNALINFEELISPSGQAGMRGFPEGRFRDLSGIVGTAEYRWYISSYLDATIFTDVGTVAGHNFSGLGSSEWFPSYGIGLRTFMTQGAYWQAMTRWGVQLAYSRDYGLRLLLNLAGF